METITRIITPEEAGSTVRHILKAALHFSSHAISRLTRAETGILGQWRPLPDNPDFGSRRHFDRRDGGPPSAPDGSDAGNWPLPVVWEGRTPAGGEQTGRYDGPCLQLCAGYSPRWRERWPGAGDGVCISPGQPLG